MDSTVIAAIASAGITALAMLIVKSGTVYAWWIERRDAKRAKQEAEEERERDQQEALKTTRVLVETIDLKNERIAMQDQIITDLIRDRETDGRRITHLETLLDRSRR
jgi:hypothetical protein